MFRRAGRRHIARTGVLSVALAGVLVGPASPARAQTGLEQAVGPIPAATAALLPADRKLWGTYTLADTPDLCKPGLIKCVDDTIAGMHTRFYPLAASCHHNAVFSLLYLRVTEGYKRVAITPGYFRDAAKVNRQDVNFAWLYTHKLDEWHAGQAGAVPPIWRLAFAAADAKKQTGSGDALLGMIAHIKRDLPFALWRIALGHREDHLAINPMLKKEYPTASAELAKRFDPTINPAGQVPGTGELVVDAIATWRDQAWRDAQDLLAAPNQEAFNAVGMRIERSAWNYGLTTYLASLASEAQNALRNNYCRSQQAAPQSAS